MNKGLLSASTKCAQFSIIEEGILYIHLLDNAEIDLEESKLMQKTSWEVMREKKFVALVDARGPMNVTKESREWGSTPEAQKHLLAQAILINSLANKMVGNFIIQFHKPRAKTRLFSDEDVALDWLKEQKKIFDLK